MRKLKEDNSSIVYEYNPPYVTRTGIGETTVNKLDPKVIDYKIIKS